MFNDIGKKIMNYMKTIYVIAIICIIISLIFDIISIASMHSSQLEAKYGANNAAAPILSSIFSHFLTAAGIYVGSWVLYAFGQLVDDVHAMRKQQPDRQFAVEKTDTDGTNKRADSVLQHRPNDSKKESVDWKCIECGSINLAEWNICRECGTTRVIHPSIQSQEKWVCETCGERNPSYRISCKNCGTYK